MKAPQLNHYYDNINNQLNFIHTRSRRVKGPSISQRQKGFLGIKTNTCPLLADLVEMWRLEKKGVKAIVPQGKRDIRIMNIIGSMTAVLVFFLSR